MTAPRIVRSYPRTAWFLATYLVVLVAVAVLA